MINTYLLHNYYANTTPANERIENLFQPIFFDYENCHAAFKTQNY